MKSKELKFYIPKDESFLSWDPENMDKYWSQCKQYDSHPLSERIFNEGSVSDNKSVQLFSCFKVK